MGLTAASGREAGVDPGDMFAGLVPLRLASMIGLTVGTCDARDDLIGRAGHGRLCSMKTCRFF